MDPTNRNTALASALTEELARCGMRRAVIAPGSRSTPLALALWRQPEIECEVVIDERSAGFVALGHALATGIPSAVLCTSGSAAANLHPALVEADQAGVPLIVLSADRPPELRGIGAGQTIDQIKLYGDAVRWFCEVGTHDADDAGLLHHRATACRAYASASGDPRPGPVHLNLSWREPLAPIEVAGDVSATDPLALQGRGDAPLTSVASTVSAPIDAFVGDLAARLARNPRGLIVAGRQLDAELAEPLVALAAATGYPILAEPISQLRRGPHDRSHVICAYDAVARARPEALTPELILRIGDMPTSKALRQWLAEIPELDQIVLDPAAGWNEPTRHATHVVRADPTLVAAAVATTLADAGEDADPAWTQSWRGADDAVSAAFANGLAEAAELSEPGAWAALGAALADGDSVLAASSMPVRDLETFLPPGAEMVRFFSNRGANGIDGLVSTAAGIAAASGGRTWAVLGDLALCHDSNGLRAARAQERLRLLVIDNAGGGIFHFLPQAELLESDEFEALLGTPSGIDLEGLVQAHGLTTAAPGSPAELEQALAGDARVVIVRTDRHRNLELHRSLSVAAERALTPP